MIISPVEHSIFSQKSLFTSLNISNCNHPKGFHRPLIPLSYLPSILLKQYKKLLLIYQKKIIEILFFVIHSILMR